MKASAFEGWAPNTREYASYFFSNSLYSTHYLFHKFLLSESCMDKTHMHFGGTLDQIWDTFSSEWISLDEDLDKLHDFLSLIYHNCYWST